MKTTVVTRQKIWKKLSGTQKRIYNFCWGIARRSEINVLYLRSSGEDKEDIEKHNKTANFKIYSLDSFKEDKHSYGAAWRNWKDITPWANLREFRKFGNAISSLKPDTVVFTYLDQVFLLDALPPNVKKILDTNDFVFIRRMRFRSKYLSYPIVTSLEEEIDIYKQFDALIAISDEEYRMFSTCYSKPILYFPHVAIPEDFNTHINKELLHLPASTMYLAGAQPNNLRDAELFLQPVAKLLSQQGIPVEIWGTLCNQLFDKSYGLQLMGTYDDLSFSTNKRYVGLNPATVGSGIKIKNIDLMANGIPVIMTNYAAEGFPDIPHEKIVIQNKAEDFSYVVLELIKNPNLYLEIARSQKNYILNNFTPEVYVQSLLDSISSL